MAGDLADDVVAVGRIGRARGVRGHVFVEPWTDDPDARFAPGSVLATDPPEPGPLTVAAVSAASGKLVVQFAGVDDREAAAALPVPFGAASEDVFAALEWRRLRLSQDQQIPEWAGARSE